MYVVRAARTCRRATRVRRATHVRRGACARSLGYDGDN